MKPSTLVLIAGAATGLAALAFAIEGTHGSGLVVHEWGTFTSIAGKDGISLEWRPLAGTNDLPSFVHESAAIAGGGGLRHSSCPKCDLTAKIRMETPVLYFYADHETNVSVRVDFPKGNITEWYPSARTVGWGIDWGRIAVVPQAKADLPVDTGPNRYYAARETDASLVRVCATDGRPTEMEKFLFYRGVSEFALPLSVVLEGDRLRFAGLSGVTQVIVFENHNGQIGYRIVDVNSDVATVQRPVLGGSLPLLLASLRRALVAQGLYDKEARAMIETWRDSWFEEGVRVFYILPRPTTDVVLPITIDPVPTSLVRVLVGRIEIITPEMENAIRSTIKRFNDPSPEVRAAARAALRQRGRFVLPVLDQMFSGSDDTNYKAMVENIFG